MNCFLTLTFYIILSLTLVQPSHVIATEPIHILVHNAFNDGRAMVVLCSSNQRPTPQARLANDLVAHGTSTGWIVIQFNTDTVHTCNVGWPHRYIRGVLYTFEAFKGSWPHGDSIRDPETRALGYGWMFNETGFFSFDYPGDRFRLVMAMQLLMSSAWFSQLVNIHVTNQFTDGRIIGIQSYLNQVVNVNQPISSGLATHGNSWSWTIERFNTRTINTCRVGWLHPNQAVSEFEFEAFIGGWRIDDSRINPSTGELKYEWLLNDTGAYLLNFINDCYELKWPMYHGND